MSGKQVHGIDPEGEGLSYSDEIAEDSEHLTPLGHTKSVQLFPEDPTKCVFIGKDLYLQEKGELLAFLRENQDIFAWSLNDL